MSTLIDRLTQALGPAYVLTGKDADPWRTEWTGRYPSDPLCVVRPGSTAEVSAILRIASDTGTPVVPISGGTGLAGGARSQQEITLSLDRMNKVHAVNASARTVIAEAGAIISTIHTAAEDQNLAFPLFFGARESARIGGALSTNAGGSNVLRYGMARDLCLGIEVVRADGEVLDLMSPLHKDNSGLNLRQLFIGAEGTLGIITKAVLKLFPAPRAYATAMVAARSLSDALALLHTLNEETGGAVEAFEWMPRNYIDAHKAMFPDAVEPFEDKHEVTILAEIGATAPRDAVVAEDGSIAINEQLEEILGKGIEDGSVLDAVVARSEGQRKAMWTRREQAAEVAFASDMKIDNDVSLPLDRIEEFITEAGKRVRAVDPTVTEQWVAHLGDGNIHYGLFFQRHDAELAVTLTQVVEDLLTELGGSFSAEHGIGIGKLGSMRRQKDAAVLETMRAVKAALDPQNILNPGKVIPAK